MQFYLIWIYPNSQMAMACHGHVTRIAGIVTKKHWQLGRSSKAEEHGVRLLIQDTVLQGHQVGVIGVSHRKFWSWLQMKELKKLRCIQVCISFLCWFSWWMHFVQNRRATSGTSFQLKFLFAPLGMNGLHKCIQMPLNIIKLSNHNLSIFHLWRVLRLQFAFLWNNACAAGGPGRKSGAVDGSRVLRCVRCLLVLSDRGYTNPTPT